MEPLNYFLDKISGISEKFIYINDDIFLNNYIHLNFFFKRKGHPKINKNNNSLNISIFQIINTIVSFNITK